MRADIARTTKLNLRIQRSRKWFVLCAAPKGVTRAYLNARPRNTFKRHALPPDEAMLELAGAGRPHDFRAELEKLARDRNLPRPRWANRPTDLQPLLI